MKEFRKELEGIRDSLSREIQGLREELSRFRELMLQMMVKDVERLVKDENRENWVKFLILTAEHDTNTLLNCECNNISHCRSEVMKSVAQAIKIFKADPEQALIKTKSEEESNKEAIESREVPKECVPCVRLINSLLERLRIAAEIAKTSIDFSKMLSKVPTEAEIRESDFLSGIPESQEDLKKLINPLSHPLRVKLLKALVYGGKHFAELSEDTGVVSGHLLFHLRNLTEGGYLIQEPKKGRYLLTSKGITGLKVLRYLTLR